MAPSWSNRNPAWLRAICSWRMNAWRRKCSWPSSGLGVGTGAGSSGVRVEGGASAALATTGPDEDDAAEELPGPPWEPAPA